MLGIKNPYRKLTPEEKLVRQKQYVQIVKDLDRLAIIAKDMLMDQRYEEVRSGFVEVQASIPAAIASIAGNDKDTLLLGVVRLQERYKAIGNLLSTPHDYLKEKEDMEKRKDIQEARKDITGK